jgi:hypothetical protein
MKQLVFGLGLMAVTFSACTKKRTTPTGFWTGKLTAPASEGGTISDMAYRINENGTMVYYGLKTAGDTANADWRGTGTWNLSGTTVNMEFFDAVSNHSFYIKGTANTNFTEMGGSWKADVIDDLYSFTAVCK